MLNVSKEALDQMNVCIRSASVNHAKSHGMVEALLCNACCIQACLVHGCLAVGSLDDTTEIYALSCVPMTITFIRFSSKVSLATYPDGLCLKMSPIIHQTT